MVVRAISFDPFALRNVRVPLCDCRLRVTHEPLERKRSHAELRASRGIGVTEQMWMQSAETGARASAGEEHLDGLSRHRIPLGR